MSQRRFTGRDRRVVGASFPTPESFYPLGITVDWDTALPYVTKDGSDRAQTVLMRGTLGGAAYQSWSQLTGSSKPLWLAAGTPNGNACLHYDGTARAMTSSTGVFPTTFGATLFMVVQALGNGSVVFAHCNLGQTQGFRTRITAGNWEIIDMAGVATITGPARTANFEVHAIRMEAAGGWGTAITTFEWYVNGVVAVSGGTMNRSQPTTYIGCGISGASVLHKMARVMYAPAALLSTTNTVAVSQSLMRAYGIS